MILEATQSNSISIIEFGKRLLREKEREREALEELGKIISVCFGKLGENALCSSVSLWIERV